MSGLKKSVIHVTWSYCYWWSEYAALIYSDAMDYMMQTVKKKQPFEEFKFYILAIYYSFRQ
jgi:hypothetical protein